MKKIAFTLIVAVAAFGVTSSAFAQDAGPRSGAPHAGHGQGQKKMHEAMKRVLSQLDLSADQKDKIQDLQEKGKAKVQELREKAKTGDKDKAREEYRAFQKENRESIQKILTREQQEKFKTLMKAEIDKMRKDRASTPPPIR